MSEVQTGENKSFEAGRQAALEGCFRLLGSDPGARKESTRQWLAGYDSVPREQRGSQAHKRS